MNYESAIEAVKIGKYVRLPEWRGYWFLDQNGFIKALTKDGDIKELWANREEANNRQDWEIAKGLDYGWAISALKNGKMVTRAGWNGKGMFIFMRPSDELEVGFVIDKVKSLPQSVKDFFKHQDEKELPSEQGLTKIKFTPYICMKNAQGEIMNGWAATQTDTLAEDWQLFS